MHVSLTSFLFALAFMFIMGAITVFTWFFLSGIPSKFEQAEQESEEEQNRFPTNEKI